MKKFLHKYILAIFTNVFFFFAVYYFSPQSRNFFIKEDSFLENMTAACFFLAFFVGVFYYFQLNKKLAHIIYLVIPGLALTAGLDEMSFGERWFRVRAPVVSQVKVDGVHDFLSVFDKFITPYSPIPNYDCLILFILTWIITSWVILRMRRRYPAFLFLIPAIAMVYAGMYLDARDDLRIYFGHLQIRIFVEELLEFNASLALLFAALAIGFSKYSNYSRTETKPNSVKSAPKQELRSRNRSATVQI